MLLKSSKVVVEVCNKYGEQLYVADIADLPIC